MSHVLMMQILNRYHVNNNIILNILYNHHPRPEILETLEIIYIFMGFCLALQNVVILERTLEM